MNNRIAQALILLPIFALQACVHTNSTRVTAPETQAAPAQLFDGMGDYEFPISTDSPEAQAYFNQGITWACAFNHDEAIRSFRKAADLDEDCAMAWWGVSLAAGPQYNHAGMTKERTAIATESMEKAFARIENTNAVERALIESLRHRNANPEPKDRTALNVAYADAMSELWTRYPGDANIASLYAEAMMVLHPWKLYDLDGTPHEDTPKILAVLEHAMELAPNHPGPPHLYIHATEPSKHPERGLDAARRLNDLVPASGHLLHMPSHIYVRTGYWEEAIRQNEKAMVSDTEYRALSPDQLVQHAYMAHNAHMGAYAAMMSGHEEDAMFAARAMWKMVPPDAFAQVGPWLDRIMCSVYDVQKRFGRWDDLLAEPAPPADLPITNATWRASRAVAFAAKKDIPNAEKEFAAFKEAKAAIPKGARWSRDSAHTVLEVSEYFVPGEIALQQGDYRKAAKLLEKAAAVEDTLSYGEPPQWLQPVRHTLGAVYLKSGDYTQAERVYREDLEEWPNNVWALYGLGRALEEQGKNAEAEKVMVQYKAVWPTESAPLTTSCKCIPQV